MAKLIMLTQNYHQAKLIQSGLVTGLGCMAQKWSSCNFLPLGLGILDEWMLFFLFIYDLLF